MWFLDDITACATVGIASVPEQLASIITTIVNVIKIGVPIILIILGMIDMGKAVASQKEDEIKKGQKTLISRCIAAGIVFFVVAIVQLLINIIAPGNDKETNLWSCINALISHSS